MEDGLDKFFALFSLAPYFPEVLAECLDIVRRREIDLLRISDVGTEMLSLAMPRFRRNSLLEVIEVASYIRNCQLPLKELVSHFPEALPIWIDSCGNLSRNRLFSDLFRHYGIIRHHGKEALFHVIREVEEVQRQWP